ncbi:MAG: TonB-dependent receptor [Pontixanthobacter sp.]
MVKDADLLNFTDFDARKLRHALYAGVAAAGLLAPSVAFAQPDAQIPQEDDDEDPTDGIAAGNLVVITASKRETTLQETPIAVTVTSGETLERAQIRDLNDLQTVAPSLRVNTLQSSANTNFIIRGFGNGANNAGIEPSVGVFIDGVYRSRSAGQIGDLANVQRIEVLRGPQSTLFGKNASAGVISVVTREPQFDFGGSVEATYGNFNQYIFKGDVTGPITDTIAVSLDGNYNKRDGYVDVPNLGIDINNRDRYSVRAQALFEPSRDFKLRLIGDYNRIDEECCYAGNLLVGPTTPAIFAVGGAIAAEDLFGDTTFLNLAPTNKIDSYGGSAQLDYNIGALTLTSISAYRELKSDNVQDVDFSSADIVNQITNQEIQTITQEFRVASDFDGPFNFLLGGFYFNEDIEQDSQLITGTQGRNFFSLLAGNPQIFNGVEAAFGLPQGSIFSPGLLTDEQFTLDNEAYSIFGTVDFEPIDGLVLTGGLNYTNDKKDFSANLTAFDELGQINLVDAGIVQGLAGFGVNGRDPAALAAFAAANPAAFGAIAAGAQNPATNPLLGLRALQFQPPFLNVPNALEDGETRDDKVTYTGRIAYQIDNNLNVYATYATGYKASSVNLSRDSRPLPGIFTPGPLGSTILAPSSPVRDAGLAVPNLSTGTRFADPEEAEVYEVGLKAQFDGLGFNIALFDQTLEGFQSNVFTGTGFALANAGEQSTKGFELDATIVPVDPLILTFALTYLDSTYDSFLGSAVGDLSGLRPAGIPEYSIATSATYTHEFGASGNMLIGRVDYNHESNTQTQDGLPAFIDRSLADPFAPARAIARNFRSEVNLVNGSLTFAMDNGLQLSAYVRNLLDDRYITTVFDGVAQAGTVSGYPNQPRTYGGTVRFKF